MKLKWLWFKKSIIDDQIAEMASLNFTALELSLFSRKKQRSKKIKTIFFVSVIISLKILKIVREFGIVLNK